MKEYIFNIHDVILLFTIMSGFLLAIFQVFTNKTNKMQTSILTIFFLNQSVLASSILFFWNDYFRSSFKYSLDALLFVQDCSYIFQGSLIYLYIATLTNKNFNLLSLLKIHITTIVLLPLIALLVFRSDLPAVRSNSDAISFYYDGAPGKMHFLIHLTAIIYGFLALIVVKTYDKNIKNSVSDYQFSSTTYITILLLGFLVVWALKILFEFYGFFNFSVFAATIDSMGIVHNYLNFFLLQFLFILSINNAGKMLAADLQDNKKLPHYNPGEMDEIIQRINNGIYEHKLHLETAINIDRFSTSIGLSARAVSAAINKHLHTNFFEFINSHRVAAAKEFLADKNKLHNSIIDIQLECGFNSKTAFNRFFKRLTGTTPSEYRKLTRVELN